MHHERPRCVEVKLEVKLHPLPPYPSPPFPEAAKTLMARKAAQT
jgi:hypothetical protein